MSRTGDGETAGPPRGWLRLLADPRFGRYLLGRMLSSAGVWIHNITAAVLAYELTRSAFVVGLVSVAQFLPQMLLAPLSGKLADRGDRKRQMLAGRFVVAAGSGAQALWLWIADVSENAHATVLVITALVVGLGFVTGGPAMHAIVPSLVRHNEIAAAVTLNTAPVTIARAAGPALGAAIAVGLGPAAAFAVATVFNLGFAAVIMTIDIPRHHREAGADQSVRAAFSYLRADRPAALILIGVTAVGIGADPAITLAPSISAAVGGGPQYTGTFASAFGVGAGLGFVVIPLVRRWVSIGHYGTHGFVLTGAGLIALVLTGGVGSTAMAFGVAGLGMTLSLTSLSAQLQERVPEAFRGRVMALWSVGYLGSRPLAAAMDGAVADLLSVDAALALVAGLVLGAAWLTRPSRLRA